MEDCEYNSIQDDEGNSQTIKECKDYQFPYSFPDLGRISSTSYIGRNRAIQNANLHVKLLHDDDNSDFPTSSPPSPWRNKPSSSFEILPNALRVMTTDVELCPIMHKVIKSRKVTCGLSHGDNIAECKGAMEGRVVLCDDADIYSVSDDNFATKDRYAQSGHHAMDSRPGSMQGKCYTQVSCSDTTTKFVEEKNHSHIVIKFKPFANPPSGGKQI